MTVVGPAFAGVSKVDATIVTVTAGKPTEFAFTFSKSSALLGGEGPIGLTFKVTNKG